MTAQTVTAAVNQKTDKPTPGALVRSYSNDFASVLPTHIKPDTWVRLAQGALKKGKRVEDGRTLLEVAAQNNTAAFLAALLDAARLGLEPGTEQYYLTPRKAKGRGLEILGIVGYQGHIELMYRAGAISSVVVEVVRQNDKFAYQPGRDERPLHEIDWDAEDRGPLRLVYAYAVMKDGATSKVVVLNKTAIERIKKSSDGADSEHSPWRNHEEAMWLKSGVRQLQKWVPTSAEYIREQLRAVRDVAAEASPVLPTPQVDHPEFVDADFEVHDDEPEPAAEVDSGDRISPAQRDKLHATLAEFGVKDRAEKLDILSTLIGQRVASSNDLSKTEAGMVLDKLDDLSKQDNPAAALDLVLAELANADTEAGA